MTHPLITIGLTAYNAQDTIERALLSALAQDWPQKEIVIADDASTDDTLSVIEKFIAQSGGSDTPIRILRQTKNQGPGAARQAILDAASGEFLAFFDDDDDSAPNRLSGQYKTILDYEQKTGIRKLACYASGLRHYPNGYTMPVNAIGSQTPVPHGQDVAARLLFFGGPKDWFFGAGTPACSLMARTSVFRAVGGFDPAFRRVEDVDFAVRLALAGGHFIGTQERFFHQYVTHASDKGPENNLDGEVRLAEKYKDYLDTVGQYDYARLWPYLRYYHFRKAYGRMLFLLCRLFLRYPVKVGSHFLTTAPRRFLHERKMKKELSA